MSVGSPEAAGTNPVRTRTVPRRHHQRGFGAPMLRSRTAPPATLATSSEKAPVSFTTTSGAKLVDGGTYGVGTVIVAKFDGPVADRGAAEKQLAVQIVPPVDGSWYWMNDQRAHWRPQSYYSPAPRCS